MKYACRDRTCGADDCETCHPLCNYAPDTYIVHFEPMRIRNADSADEAEEMARNKIEADINELEISEVEEEND